jgi:hypothetical protein
MDIVLSKYVVKYVVFKISYVQTQFNIQGKLGIGTLHKLLFPFISELNLLKHSTYSYPVVIPITYNISIKSVFSILNIVHKQRTKLQYNS